MNQYLVFFDASGIKSIEETQWIVWVLGQYLVWLYKVLRLPHIHLGLKSVQKKRSSNIIWTDTTKFT